MIDPKQTGIVDEATYRDLSSLASSSAWYRRILPLNAGDVISCFVSRQTVGHSRQSGP